MNTLTNLCGLFGFQSHEVEMPLDKWLSNKLQEDKIIGEWNGKNVTIHCIPNLHSSRLKRWVSDSTQINSMFVIGELDSLIKCLDYFGEGEIDILLDSQNRQYIEFSQSGSYLLTLITEALNRLQAENTDYKALQEDFVKVNEKIQENIISDPFILNLTGKLCSYYGNSAEAGKYFRMATEAEPQFGEAYSNLGTLLWNVGKRREAFILFSEGLIRNPYGVSCQLNFFDATYELREFESAVKIINSLKDKIEDRVEYKHHLAILYHYLNETNKSKSVLIEILSKNPNDQEARNLLKDFEASAAQNQGV